MTSRYHPYSFSHRQPQPDHADSAVPSWHTPYSPIDPAVDYVPYNSPYYPGLQTATSAPVSPISPPATQLSSDERSYEIRQDEISDTIIHSLVLGEANETEIPSVLPFKYEEPSDSDSETSRTTISPPTDDCVRKPPTRRHPCNMCTRAFDRPSTLKKHLLVHTGEKAFVCPTCLRRFSIASNRNRHVPRCPVALDARSDVARTFLMYTRRTPESDSPLSTEPTEGPRPVGAIDIGAKEPEYTFVVSRGSPVSPPSRPRPRRQRRAPSPLNWVPESLKGFKITSVKSYLKSYSNRARISAHEKKRTELEEKHRQQMHRLEKRRLELISTEESRVQTSRPHGNSSSAIAPSILLPASSADPQAGPTGPPAVLLASQCLGDMNLNLQSPVAALGRQTGVYTKPGISSFPLHLDQLAARDFSRPSGDWASTINSADSQGSAKNIRPIFPYPFASSSAM